MDKEEYKRQNEERDTKKKTKSFRERWFGWWKTPSDRFAFFIALFTLALAVESYFQLDAMRHTDAAINEQLKEAHIQNETTRAQIRANMAANGISISAISVSDNVIGWEISPSWKNVGSTDARNFRSRWVLKFVPKNDLKTDVYSACPKVVAPADHVTVIQNGHPITELSKRLTKEDAERAARQEGVVLLAESMEFNDIFKDSAIHHLYYCALVVPNDIANSQFSFPTLILETD
jgi:hypothetical protein